MLSLVTSEKPFINKIANNFKAKVIMCVGLSIGLNL